MFSKNNARIPAGYKKTLDLGKNANFDNSGSNKYYISIKSEKKVIS